MQQQTLMIGIALVILLAMILSLVLFLQGYTEAGAGAAAIGLGAAVAAARGKTEHVIDEALEEVAEAAAANDQADAEIKATADQIKDMEPEEKLALLRELHDKEEG